MRGTLSRLGILRLTTGIIPAHAGNTALHCPAPPFVRDHPRACGEHIADEIGRGEYRGSSPRMRGTPELQTVFGELRGIIPAHAGNTEVVAHWVSFAWDHPRACGEHKHVHVSTSIPPGSSPRMRGTRFTTFTDGAGNGIIPAHAGNTGIEP